MFGATNGKNRIFTHPNNVVQSASLEAIEPPEVGEYECRIPREVFARGLLSDLQIETLFGLGGFIFLFRLECYLLSVSIVICRFIANYYDKNYYFQICIDPPK